MKPVLLFLFLVLLFRPVSGQVKHALDDGRKIKIPVVFHVIYRESTENVSDSFILAELHQLNADYSARNDMSQLDNDFRQIVGNPNIEFFLYDTTLHETSMKGVRRIPLPQVRSREALLVQPGYCLNVFVAAHGNAANIGGDRVNVNYEDVGVGSRALTHEVGHWLGLYHIFGQIKNSRWDRVLLGNHDDRIDDTPLQKRATAVCYTITPRCPCPPLRRYYRGHKTLYNNFMDYNPCRNMFTIKQAIQMRNTIIKDRSVLFETSQ
jgi:hypothetical protein